ncbi:MAG: HDIG domain-containing metalloprotein [Chloroflexota bacterium]
MGVPTLADAELLLASFELPAGIVTHARGVSLLAAEAARLLEAAAVAVNPHIVAVAALLHDVDKVETRDHGAEHGLMAARWMAERGFAELSEPIASHPILCLLDPSRAPRGWASVAVAVADRRVAQGFVSIDQRIDDLERRYPEVRADLEAARAPAHAMQGELATAAGLSSDELEARLAAVWSAAAPPSAARP